jgi:hypothetical protein
MALGPDSLILDERKQGGTHRLAGAETAIPTETPDSIGVQSNDRHIALPSTVPARKFETRSDRQSKALNRKLCDLPHGNVVTSGHVISIESLLAVLVRMKDCVHDIEDVNVGLALSAVTENRQARWICEKISDKIETYTMSLTRSNHVGKAKRAACEIEHVAVCADEGFSGELARAIG